MPDCSRKLKFSSHKGDYTGLFYNHCRERMIQDSDQTAVKLQNRRKDYKIETCNQPIVYSKSFRIYLFIFLQRMS